LLALQRRPDLVHLEMTKTQSGQNQKRLPEIGESYTGIWGYASYPNHYAGDGSFANKMGGLILNSSAGQWAKLLKTVKKDKTIIDIIKYLKIQSNQNKEKISKFLFSFISSGFRILYTIRFLDIKLN
jgi:creatinine amidohydrolase